MASGHFDDKVCVVTGAASGIGSAVSEALLRAGAVVVLADRDADRRRPSTVWTTRQGGWIPPLST